MSRAWRAWLVERLLRPAVVAWASDDRDRTTGDEDDVYIDDEPTLPLDPLPPVTPPVATAEAPSSPPSGHREAALPPLGTGRETPPPRGLGPGRRAPAAQPQRRREALPWALFVPVAAGLAALIIGGALFAMRGPDPQTPAQPTAQAAQPSGPPLEAPMAGRVTVGLAATEDSAVRVTVDGVVQFDGVLRAGQRQAWEGGQRIQVWTDNGRTLQLAVNGLDLGAYSPAMEHPDWNRIDFGFWPGWEQ
ncbi:MAG: RodZ domain-containing protein [Dehalococcoidia bacterium]